MNSAVRRSFKRMPSSLPAYARVMTSRKPLLAATPIETVAVEFDASDFRVDRRHLARYREVCGIPDAPYLPPAYPHVLAMPLHMQVFTAPSFPVKVLGLVHLHNVIRQWRPIPVDARLHLFGGFQTAHETERGQEYELLTRCEVDGQVAWEEVSTMLARAENAPGKRPRAPRPPKDQGVAPTKIHVAENTGRRYARVSGDLNPIHLMAATAKLFRFKQAVAHGMWSMARSLGAAATQLPPAPMEIETQFQFPLFLPSDTTLQCWQNNNVLHITLSDERGLKPHLAIEARSLATDK